MEKVDNESDDAVAAMEEEHIKTLATYEAHLEENKVFSQKPLSHKCLFVGLQVVGGELFSEVPLVTSNDRCKNLVPSTVAITNPS